MRIPAIPVLLLSPAMAMAQNYPGMSESDMQRMMQQMQEAQACMQGIDQSRLQALEQEGRAMETEIKTLCASGQRDAAQARVMAYAREVNDNPDIRKIRECGEKLQGMMPVMPYMAQGGAPDAAGGHVCDP